MEIQKKLFTPELEKINFSKFGRKACKRARPPPPELRKHLNHSFHKVGGFTAHPDDKEELTISMKSIGYLKDASTNLIHLERRLNGRTDDNFLKNGLGRYQKFMDLKAKYPDQFLVPTIDIECIWMSHLMRPLIYQKDCKKLYGKVVDHHLTSKYDSLLIEKALEITSRLWKDTYEENYSGELFTYEERETIQNLLFVNLGKNSKKSKEETSFSISFDDLKKDREWFNLYNNFMNEYRDRSKQTNQIDYQIKSYERFMYMNAVYPEIAGHPSYAIDLIWHSHMAHPLDYIFDCKNVVGYLVDHAPWPEKFDEECQVEYKKLWEKEFSGNPLEKDHMLLFSE